MHIAIDKLKTLTLSSLSMWIILMPLSMTMPILVKGATETNEAPPEKDQSNYHYRIELLVFGYTNHAANQNTQNSERWRNPPRPNTDSFLLDSTKLLRNKPHEFLKLSEFSELGSIMNKMKINGNFRTLYHRIWEQYVVEQNQGDHFYLSGGQAYLTEHGLKDYLEGDVHTPQTLNAFKQPELEGTLHFYRSRFLHIKTDLWMSDYAGKSDSFIDIGNDTSQNSPQLFASTTNYHLSQHRRIRSGELHYLDHPRFGLLIKFTRLDKPLDQTEPTTD